MNQPADLELLQNYLDGALSEAQVQFVESRLRAEPDLADLLIRLAREEAVLREWSLATAESARLQAAAEAVARLSLPERDAPPARIQWVPLALSAAILVGTITLFLRWGGSVAEGPVSSSERPVLASLSEVYGRVTVTEEDGSGVVARGGEKLHAGQSVRTDAEASFAVLTYADGTRLELNTASELHLPADALPGGSKRLCVRLGYFTADVAKQPPGRPMLISTPQADIRVLGTRFSTAIVQGETRVDLDEGRVQLTRRADGQSVDVLPGSYAVAAAEPVKLEPHPLSKRVSEPRAEVVSGTGPVLSIDQDPKRGFIASAGWDGILRLYDLETAKLVNSAVGHRRKHIRWVEYAPDGAVLATGGNDKYFRLWDPEMLATELISPRQKVEVHFVRFAPDGRFATDTLRRRDRADSNPWRYEGHVVIWNRAGEQEKILKPHPTILSAMAFSPDGSRLAVGCRDGSVHVWDVAAGERLRQWPSDAESTNGIAFSPDGRQLATAHRDGTVRLWDAASGEELRVLRGHNHHAQFVDFSPDGRLLASGANDGTARLWDVRSGREVITFRGHRYRVCAVLFAGDGKTLVTSGWDKTIKFWDLPPALWQPPRQP